MWIAYCHIAVIVYWTETDNTGTSIDNVSKCGVKRGLTKKVIGASLWS